ncbi:MAG: efflux RND transporter permease subunit, partial [Pseudomonadota bacterium]
PSTIASAVISDEQSTIYFLILKIYEVLELLVVSLIALGAGWLVLMGFNGLGWLARSEGLASKLVLGFFGLLLITAFTGLALALVAVTFLAAGNPVAEGESVLPAITFVQVLVSLAGLPIVAAAAYAGLRTAQTLGAPGAMTYLTARFYDHRVWMLAIGWFSLLVTVLIFTQIPGQFQPTVDDNRSTVNIELVPGATLGSTKKVVDEVAALLSKEQEFDYALERIRIGNGTIFVNLRDDRERTSIEFERQLAPVLAQIPDARVRFRSQSGGFGSGRDITVMLAGSNPDLLDETATNLIEEMKGLTSLVAPRVEGDLNRPELIITPRREIAAELGVSTVALSQTIRIATLGEIEQNAARFSLSDRQIPIKVKLSEADRTDITTIENLPVPTLGGGTVPLSRVADISFGSGPTVIQRYNQNRRVLVGADLADGVLKGAAQEEINALPTLQDLPTGVIRDTVGEDQWQQELVASLQIAIIAGFLLVFACLVLLYKRLISPLVNMTSLLLAPLGGILLIWLLGQPQSMPVYIGILLLLGIVSKNSILLIDFAIEEMERGTDKLAALLEAGHKRAQPIVMTTVAMTAGMVPTALSLTGDEAWRKPMGIVVIGGLIMSTLLTLLIVPAGFSLADGFEKRAGPWLRKRMLTYKPGDDGALLPGDEPIGPPALPPGPRPALPLPPGAQPAE